MRKFKKLKEKRLKGKKNKKVLVFATVALLFFLFLSFIFFIFKLQSLKKFAYVSNKDGNVEIIIVDSQKDKYLKMLISKDFNLESSRNYGQYEIGNLWILGQKDGFKGKLIAETVTKNFSIPIFLWKDGRSSNLNLLQRLKSIIVQKELTEYDYVLKTVNTPDTVLVNFIDSEMEFVSPKLEMVDLTGSNSLAKNIVNILGVYGVKTTSYSKGYDENLDCEVSGFNQYLVDTVVKIFSCEKKEKDVNVDLRIRIGKVFADRF
ncbi:MAG TPA: hypothetical protein VI795_00760 [Patescibacteria group bacterium]|nr:hypothetical protein [Patescibacteria group bacterium]